jgi:hypothetical protein
VLNTIREALTDFAAQTKHLRKQRGQINRHRGVRRFEPQIEMLDGDGLAAKGDLTVAQKCTNDFHSLAHARYRLGVVDAMLDLDLDLVAGAKAKHEAAVGKMIDARRGHRNRRRGAHEDAADRRPQAHPGCCERDRGQQRELVAAMAFDHPRRFVSGLFGEPRAFDRVGRRQPRAQRDTEAFHGGAQDFNSSR